jgi:site-specific DNA-methyltransferase (adenine-specific)
MEIVNRKVSELIPYDRNPRKNDEAVKHVKASIEQFGFKVPIVIDADGVIVAGHTRLKAAKELGWAEVPCIVADDLTPEQVKAFRLADNKTAEMAEWDDKLLQVELLDLVENFDMADFGFEIYPPTGEVSDDDFDVDAVADAIAEPVTKLGDIWTLGRHRLMCGDSTDRATVDRLMDGQKADMVFTDPPYNINYRGVSDDRKIMNDSMDDDSFTEFLGSAFMPCETFYVCCSWQNAHLFRKAMENTGMSPKAMIVWDKINPAQHLDKYFKQHEIIWYYGEFGGEKTIRGDVWQVKRQQNTLHPTMKPVELIEMALTDNPKKRIIYDAFGGSGSTLIACEQLNRTCYMMELDPKYCDVIIKRWESLTGQKAVLLNG